MKQELDKETLLKTVEFKSNGKLDTETIHPKNIFPLMQAGYILSMDDEDSGENSYYLLTERGAKILNND